MTTPLKQKREEYMSETDAVRIDKAALEVYQHWAKKGHTWHAPKLADEFKAGIAWRDANPPTPMEAKVAGEKYAGVEFIGLHPRTGEPLYSSEKLSNLEFRELRVNAFLVGDANGASRERIKVVEEIADWYEKEMLCPTTASQIRARFRGVK